MMVGHHRVIAGFLNAEYRHVGYLLPLVLKSARFGGFAPLYHRPASHEGKDMGGLVCAAHRRKNMGFPTRFQTVLGAPGRAQKNATGLCYLWRCPGRWPVCIQLYGQGEQAPIDRLCTHISAFRGLSACQGSLNSSKIVVNEAV